MAITCPKCQHENPEDTLFCGKCGASLESDKGVEVTKTFVTPKQKLQKGSTLGGRYTILEELGRGEMGVVYMSGDGQAAQKKEGHTLQWSSRFDHPYSCIHFDPFFRPG